MSLSPRLRLRSFLESAPIIGVLLATLVTGGCSAARLGYNNSPTLVYWWLDSYFDFDDAQSLRVRNDLQTLQDWHRKAEVPLLAQKLKDLQAMAPKAVSAEQVCALVSDLQTRVQVTLERATPTIAAIAPGLQGAQLEHMTREFERRNRKWQDDWIAGTLAERSERRVKQLVERAESFYGPLEDTQLTVVRAHIANSSFDGPRQLQEMQRRQKDALQVLKKIRAGEIPLTQTNTQVRGLLERTLKSPVPAYRSYMDQITSEGCSAMAALHNASTPEQRTRLVQALKGYEEDARALAAQRPEEPSNDQPPSAL
jgi:peptidyl-tRNA hydrolase